jgi:uncharacterized protein (DUF983 family)
LAKSEISGFSNCFIRNTFAEIIIMGVPTGFSISNIYLYYMIEEEEKRPMPNLLWSIFTMRCPRCRRGEMFQDHNPYKNLKLRHIFNMYHSCPVCHQKYNLEPGFWYGTGYVSYGLAVLISGISFIAWWFIIGISVNDNRVFYWLAINAVLVLALQPWLMRISRVMYLYLFVKYNKNYDKDDIVSFS